MSWDGSSSAADPAVCGLIYKLLQTLTLKLKEPLSLFFLCKTNRKLLLQIRMWARAAKDTKPKANKGKLKGLFGGVCCCSQKDCWFLGEVHPEGSCIALAKWSCLPFQAYPPKTSNGKLYGEKCADSSDVWVIIHVLERMLWKAAQLGDADWGCCGADGCTSDWHFCSITKSGCRWNGDGCIGQGLEAAVLEEPLGGWPGAMGASLPCVVCFQKAAWPWFRLKGKVMFSSSSWGYGLSQEHSVVGVVWTLFSKPVPLGLSVIEHIIGQSKMVLLDLLIPFLLFVVGLRVALYFLILQMDLVQDALGWPRFVLGTGCVTAHSQSIQQHKKGRNCSVLPPLQPVSVLLPRP